MRFARMGLVAAIALLMASSVSLAEETIPDIVKNDLAGMFEAPIRLKAGDNIVSVESPGYACPTIADVDGDGRQDLVVGQFAGGYMQFCRNVAALGQPPEFAAAEWLKSGDDRAEVPGVW